jgi:uncharacterized protein YbcI
MSGSSTLHDDVPTEREPRREDGQLAQVTRAMVAIYKEQYGRGPTHAHSYQTGPDAITCLLAGSLTPVERTIVRMGEVQRLRDIRTLFQYAAEDTFRAAVEAITGRRVVGFISGIDARADVASEMFMFESSDQASIA